MPGGGALTVDGLEVVYGGVVRALHGVSLEVAPGETVALLGGNGAGKTTLLRAVTGLLPVHRGQVRAGRVLLDGAEVTGLDAPALVRRGVAQVMEGRRIFQELSVEENLRTGAFTQRDRVAREASRARVFELFPRLSEREGLMAGLLSGGEQQMLAIGRALMAAPRLLLLDEPSLGLAPQVVGRIAEVIAEIAHQGTSVLLVEQNARMALKIADRAYVLETGRIVTEGRSTELLDDKAVQSAYLGIKL